MPGLSKKEKRLTKRASTVAVEEPRLEWPEWARRMVGHPATSYITIFLLQLRVIWGMWWYKDLTTGDTSSYFLGAVGWFRGGIASLVWSPLYTSFIGELLHLSRDAYTVVILHRLLIVLTLALLVLALMRRLLPPGIAWMTAAWWVVLPIDYNALYEVHLFAVIPLILAPLVLLWKPGPWGRGGAIAMLVVTGVLMRNENLAAAALLGGLCLGYEFGRNRDVQDPWAAFQTGLRAYGMPLLGASLLILFYYAHRMPYDSWALLRAKHDLVVCQSFAAGYEQRMHAFARNAMADCGQLMERIFGSSSVSLTEAWRANRSAMLDYFWFNIRLLPSGLQVLLFNFRSGDENPDFVATYPSSLVLIPSVVTGVVLALGVYFFFAGRKRWIETWRREYARTRDSVLEARVWAWITLLCLCLVVCGVIVTNRPRPSYMFVLGITLRALLGLCGSLVLRHGPRIRTAMTVGAVAVVAAAFTLPNVYQHAPSPRPLLKAYRRLQPFEKLFHEPNPLLVSYEFGGELASYDGKCTCASRQFYELRAMVTPERTLAQAFEEAGATLFLADETILTDPLALEFVNHAGQLHWDVVARSSTRGENWAVLHRQR